MSTPDLDPVERLYRQMRRRAWIGFWCGLGVGVLFAAALLYLKVRSG